MKKTLVIVLALTCIMSLRASNWVSIKSAIPGEANVKLISSDIESSTVMFSFDGFSTSDIPYNGTILKSLSLKGGAPLLRVGCPELLKLSSSLIIPDDAEMKVEVISSSYIDYNNYNIAPSKGNLYRDIDPSTVAFTYGKEYSKNAFFPGKLAELQQPYIIRDYRGQTITTYPFQYNPVTKVLRVYYNMTVKISRLSSNGTNKLLRTKELKSINTDFKAIYDRHFLNSGISTSKYAALNEQGSMLIISSAQYIPSIQPLANWRNISGIPTDIINVDSIGNTTAAIQNCITNYYNQKGLTFVLLVGDAAQVTTYTVSGGGSDNTYSYLVGNDHYPDIFVGRISAEAISHVQTQVQKILTYEKNPVTGNGWMNHGIGIASAQGPGDSNEYDYQHIRNIRNKLLNFHYAAMSELYDGSEGGMDAAGDPTPAMVSTEINNGAGIIHYTGHGSNTSWGTSGFSNTDIGALTNVNMWPFVCSVGCVNGNFVSTTCFAEAWMRATYNGQPSGAIATLMSTINQSWSPPMVAQDEMVNILIEGYPDNIKHTFGGVSMNGCMRMNDIYGTAGDEMTDTWTIFGDPALMLRTDTPKTMVVTYSPTIMLGSTQFPVNCDVNGALVTLSINNRGIGSGYVINGTATINFGALTTLDTITVVATKYNYIPFIGKLQVIAPSGPFVQYNSSQIVDITGNNNGLADFNENITLNVGLKNLGISTAHLVNATLSTPDTNIIITSNQHTWGDIAAGITSVVNNAYAITVKNGITDQHTLPLTLSIQDNAANSWSSQFNLTLNAPVLITGTFTAKDTVVGNNNGVLDPGETAVIYIQAINNGHSGCTNAIGTLTTTNPNITFIGSPTFTIGDMAAGSTIIAVYQVQVSATASLGSLADFTFTITSGVYHATNTYLQAIGALREDFETDNFNRYSWMQSGTLPWTITSTLPYQGLYSAKSGAITDNQTSELYITMNVLSADTISFYKKVSCEQAPGGALSYDYLEFLIDDVSTGKWDGEVAWSQNSYAVGVGTHTFKWRYLKDANTLAGSDCAWLDYIKFPSSIGLLGINELNTSNLVNVYPNPVKDKVTIEYCSDKDVKLMLLNSLGQVLETRDLKSNNATKQTTIIDVSTYSKGIYYCTMLFNDKVITKKLIIQ